MLLCDVSRLTLCRPGPDASYHPPRSSHLSMFWGKRMKFTKIHNLKIIAPGMLFISYTCFHWVLIIFLPQSRYFSPDSFSPAPLASNHRKINSIYLSPGGRSARPRSHSDVYFYSQVYLTLKPQNNLFICPAVAKVHNNTPGEPPPRSLARMQWPVAFEGFSPRKEMTIMFLG